MSESGLILMKTLIVLFDSGGESDGSERARMLQRAFQLQKRILSWEYLIQEIDVWEIEAFVDKLEPPSVCEQYVLDSELCMLSDIQLVHLLLARQHQLTISRYESLNAQKLSVGIQKIFPRRLVRSALKWSEKYNNEELLRETYSRLYHDVDRPAYF